MAETDAFGCLIPDGQVDLGEFERMKARLAELEALLARPKAPDQPIPDDQEPPDIRKTNAADDPCPACQQVHPKDAYTPITCRCLYCGKIGPVAMSTYDPRLGSGVVCHDCCRGAGPRDLDQIGAEALARDGSKMPWQ